MVTLELADMQGLIARGYEHLTAAAFLLLRIKEKEAAKAYLSDLLGRGMVTPAQKEQVSELQKSGGVMDRALHIAFTESGLRKLGLGKEIMGTFSREFLEGMVDKCRSMLLGDTQDNDPDCWLWGSGNKKIDLLLLCYAENQQKLAQILSEQKSELRRRRIELLLQRKTYETVLSKHGIFLEHFGFRDGISTPLMDGLSRAKGKDEKLVIQAGEFVLGYKNEYGVYPDSPVVSCAKDPLNILPFKGQQGSQKDLGKNGTYLVFRQLEQHVYQFWQYLKAHSREAAATKEAAAIRLGAKMVGRWPGGAPLVLAKQDDPSLANANHFGYFDTDHEGCKCPFGAHIRRANPRDQLHSGRDKERSAQMVRKHQMLRRGRIYGRPLVESMKPEDMLQVPGDDHEERGLHFICLVSHIGRQFEFVQNVWANNFAFADLCNEVDPLISPRPAANEPHCNEFTVQAQPLRRSYKNVPQFTQVKGGAYFFMPGLKALKFIAAFPPL